MSNIKIYLAYSSDKTQDSETLRNRKQWTQLELFPSEKHDALIFTMVDNRNFEKVVELILDSKARYILDLRELPALNFERVSRSRFFEFLEQQHVTYTKIFSIFPHIDAYTVTEIFDNALRGAGANALEAFHSSVRPLIEGGPTIVFTDTPPASDEHVTDLVDALQRAKVHFTTMVAEDTRPLLSH